MGRPTIGEVHITDEEGNDLPPGEAGVIRFAGGTKITYHNDPDKTRAAYDSVGRPTVGDMGYLDEDGYL